MCLYEARGRLRWQSARTRVVMLLHFGLKRSVDDFGLRRPHSSGQKKKERDSFPSSSSSLSQSISLSLTVWREKAIFENSCRPALQLFIITITTGMDGFKKTQNPKAMWGRTMINQTASEQKWGRRNANRLMERADHIQNGLVSVYREMDGTRKNEETHKEI